MLHASSGLTAGSPGSSSDSSRAVARGETCKRHADVVRKIDQELPLAARVVKAHEPACAGRVRLREHDQRGRELVHVVDALDAVTIEQRLVARILPGDRA